jgi:hypothetical protein
VGLPGSALHVSIRSDRLCSFAELHEPAPDAEIEPFQLLLPDHEPERRGRSFRVRDLTDGGGDADGIGLSGELTMPRARGSSRLRIGPETGPHVEK